MIRACVLIALLAAVLNGCSNDSGTTPLSPAPNSGSSSFTGTLTDGAQSGKLTVTVASGTLAPALRARSAAITATGLIQWGGGTPDAHLSGTYNAQTDSIDIAGEGYTVHGFHSTVGGAEGITGEFDGPGGHGGFTTCFGPASSIKVFCGTFTSTVGGEGGTWNLAAKDSVFLGIAVNESGTRVPFYGTARVAGFQEKHMEIWTIQPGVGAVSIGSGTWYTDADSMAGTYSLDNGTSAGTWRGDLCLAQPPPPPPPPPFALPAPFTGMLLSGSSSIATLNLTILPPIVLYASGARYVIPPMMPDSLPVTGTYQFPGGPANNVSGSLDLRYHRVHLRGANNEELRGRLFRQGGSGAWTIAGDLLVNGTPGGGFGCFLGGPDAVSSYCGTWASSASYRGGTVQFILSAPSVMFFGGVFGVAPGSATGDGATKALTATGRFGSYPLVFTTNVAGTVNTDTHEASGTWVVPAELQALDLPDDGSWTATPCP